MNQLRQGQIIVIDGQKYVVRCMIEFTEKGSSWNEYELLKYNNGKLDSYPKYWFTIEKDDFAKEEYYLYNIYGKKVNYSNLEFDDNGKKYKLCESGTAIVKSFFGPTDVDQYEKCEYYDYASANRDEIISVEVWCDETEYTIGKRISNEHIQIKDEIDEEYMNKEGKKKSFIKTDLIIILVVSLLCIYPVIISLLKGIFVNKSIDKYLSKNTEKYTYVTSVTNNSNNKKAKVYKSKFNASNETLVDIINGTPEGIIEVMDDDIKIEEDGYGLETKSEFAYIYMEDGVVYVQVSSKQFLNESGTTYHSSHNNYYHRSYSRRIRSTTYYNYASSAKQASINSRNSSGGGISSGK